MRKKVTGQKERVLICLVEHNSLAARFLRQLLDVDPASEVVPADDVLSCPCGRDEEASVFILDRGTVHTPFSKVLHLIHFKHPQAKTIILDEQIPPEELFRLLFVGIHGYVPYGEVEEHLCPAVHAVSEGHLWVAQEVLEQYVTYSSRLSRLGFKGGQRLTKREIKIVELVQRRLSNKEISTILNISESTVKFHLSNIFSKLGVHDRHEVGEVLTFRAEEPALQH